MTSNKHPTSQRRAQQAAKQPTPQAADQAVRWLGLVNSPDGLNLRPTPDTLNPPLAVLSHETPLQVLDDAGEWLRVIADGQEGYVYAAHVLRRLDPQPLEPDPGAPADPEAGVAAPGDQQISLGANAGFLERVLARVWNRYGGALLAEAQRLGVDPTFAAALLALESGGEGFGPSGRMVIRFENHIFYHYWGQHHQAQYFAHFAFDSGATWRGHRWRPDPNTPWQECHLDQGGEWQVFSFARQLDETAAMLAISMGLAQVMGFNHAAVRFSSVQAMFQALAGSIAEQISAFFRFVESRQAVEAMRTEDYATFARTYNGGGQVDAYAAKLRDYVATLRGLRQPAAVPAAAAVLEPSLPEPAAAPWSFPEPTPAEAAEEAAHYRRWWLSVGGAAFALLLAIAAALYQGGWRLVRKEELSTDSENRLRG